MSRLIDTSLKELKMKIKSWLTLIAFTTVIFLFVGSFRAVNSEIRIVSDSEFEEILGHNAAVKQFGNNSMLIETRKIKVNKFLKKEMPDQIVDENGDIAEESDYAKGYHKALNVIERKKLKCPY